MWKNTSNFNRENGYKLSNTKQIRDRRNTQNTETDVPHRTMYNGAKNNSKNKNTSLLRSKLQKNSTRHTYINLRDTDLAVKS